MNPAKKKIHAGLSHSIWSVLDAALYPVAYLATVPAMMRYLGLPVFGAWLVFNSLITILQLLNFNMGVANLGVATIRSIAAAVANNDTAHARDIINSMLHITAVLLAVACGTGLLLAYPVVKHQWWGLHEASGVNIGLCIILSAVFAGLKYFDQVFQTVIKAYEYFKLASILNMVNRFGLLAINLVAAMNHLSLVVMLAANIVYLALYVIAQYMAVRWKVPTYHFGKVRDTALYKRMLKFSMLPWLQTIIIVVTFQADRFWVSSYAGIKEVSFYGLVSTMFNHIHMIFTAMAVWVLPRIAAMAAQGGDPEKLYGAMRGILLAFITVSLLVFYFISPTLFTLWMGKEAYAGMYIYIQGFVAFEIVFAHTIMPFLYLNAAGKEKAATIGTIIYCGVCYVLMVGGLLYFHSAAALVQGMVLAMCLTMPVINAMVQQHMRQSYSWKLAVGEMLPMYAAVALVYSSSNVLAGIVLAVAVLALLWKFYLSSVINMKLWKQSPKM